ncbi:hypothetical protein A3J77_02065 [Candidatus Wolfebacteria bacterium RBG_13_41_7]|uniref:Uncharacterized protein n=1 Tax=Candidatus Wolfebacteria bacterium RBG_13_41_7 TaxID=1802554 RepID=A0A1F8DKA0_9BACT|nr:MAG: hypothetical protein A3J77_02065 [Candidatus Wolfebacteria bacterium RBG_13_41_7]
MARVLDKQKAVELRLRGYSYSQIKSELKISKSTLSGWLKNYPLSEERIKELTSRNEKRIENYRKTRQRQKEEILKKIYQKEKAEIFPLSKRDLFIAGLFLYWGEGAKTKDAEVSLSNTNPAMAKFFVYWLENSLKIDRNKIKIKLHLYKDMDIRKEIDFWTKELKFSESQFTKPYIKDSNKSSITYKNGFGHGTCNITIGNAILMKRVLMGLKSIEDYFNLKYK